MAQTSTKKAHANVPHLIEKCKKGDKLAQSHLYSLFAPKMLGVTSRYAFGIMEAEDLLIIGFTKVFSKINTYSGEGSFEGWMRRIMLNCAFSLYRQNERLIKAEFLEENELEALGNIYSTSDTTHLMQALNSLPEFLRVPFSLFAVEGYSHREISSLLSITEALSKVRVLRARKLLQERLRLRESRLNRIYHAA